MATQMLNADADLVTIQDLLGHSSIITTQRYCKVSNLKVQRDYFKAMEKLTQRNGPPADHHKDATSLSRRISEKLDYIRISQPSKAV